MFRGTSHFQKQERMMRKFIHDPNTSVNQDMSAFSGSGGLQQRPTGNTPLLIPGSVGQSLAHSYGKR